ncbi:MAG TPA: hypothetical protein VM146_10220 [Steroidobacteraceae bacterium]|nr:hypothetical protein [Steroidobacteraceae bacterium]
MPSPGSKAWLSAMLGEQEELAIEGHVTVAHLIRLTKDLATLFAAGLVALASGATTAEAGCGQTAGASSGHERRATIALQNLESKGPVFYWHDSATYALLYFRPEDLVARLETLLTTERERNGDLFADASLGPALLDNIKVDLPLKESTDLFRYTLIDQRFDSVVNLVLADLMKDGKVMLDQWVFVDEPARSIVMVSHTDSSGEAGRWFCTSKDEVLFKVGYATFE